MTIQEKYEEAKRVYRELGVDTDAALETLKHVPISMHCWQGDDVMGFEGATELTGGIQATGDYPGRARTPEELMMDIDQALRLIPGKHRLNLHASYAIFEDGKKADRNALKPEHFKKWVEFAKARGLGLDFNPTFFSHPLASPFTLSSPDENIRRFWIDHGKACLRIAEYFAASWAASRWLIYGFLMAIRIFLRTALGRERGLRIRSIRILSIGYDKSKVLVAIESKVFGIGMESYTVGSHEFCMNYAAKNGILCLLDNGHYHPTEMVSDKIPSMLLFNEKLALHVTRPGALGQRSCRYF